MTEYICKDVSTEMLVAYSDGELPPSEAEQIKEHIARCESCQTMLNALQRSLQVTQEIWRSDETQWLKKHSFKKPVPNRWLVRWVAAVAASILLVFGIGVMRRLLYKPGGEIFSNRPEPTADEIEFEVHRAAVAAQMLSVADMLAAQASGREYAEKRYEYIINSFADRDESRQAKIRLQTLLERRVKQ